MFSFCGHFTIIGWFPEEILGITDVEEVLGIFGEYGFLEEC